MPVSNEPNFALNALLCHPFAVSDVVCLTFAEVMDLILSYDAGKNFVFNKAKGQVMKMTKGLYPAPLKIIEVGVSK